MTNFQWEVVISICKILMKHVAFTNIYNYETNRKDFELINEAIRRDEMNLPIVDK